MKQEKQTMNLLEKPRFLEIDGHEKLEPKQILSRSKNLTPVMRMRQQLDENRMPMPPPPTFAKVSL